MKFCSICKKEKNDTDFYKAKNIKGGLRSACKECRKKYNRTPKEAKKWYDNHLESHLVSLAKQRAKKKNIVFDLKPKDIIIPDKCPLLGISLYRGSREKNGNSPSIDRIDAKKGYTKSNVWIISKKANRIKTNATIEEIERVAYNLREYITSKSSGHKSSAADPMPLSL